MTTSVTLAIDAMSGDHGFRVSVEAAVRALERHPALRVILVGDDATLRRALSVYRDVDASRLELQHAGEIVAMDESPSKALRNKKDSSLRVAIDLVKDGRARAAVSAGNTGALMATARFVLKTLPGIDRPAFVSPLPTVRGATHVLDLGANADCSPEQLAQFAVMGSALVTAVRGIERPRVALLNIGEEEIKGNDTIKRAAALLASSSLNYVGFIEADKIFLNPVEVVVCDGFVGNVALKAGEGVSRMMAQFMREEFSRTLQRRLIAWVARSVLRAMARRMDPRVYNGASLLGLQGSVVKSHGSADALAFANAIGVAMREVELDVPAHIGQLMTRMSPAPMVGASK
jgi:glycerol-3-phosphate acyltransferase PlsX